MAVTKSDPIEVLNWGEAMLRALPCPACGGHDWTAALGGAAYCAVCNCRAETRHGNSEGYVVEFDSEPCWEHQHREAIPAFDDPDTGERKGRPATVKFLSVRPGCGPEWWSATAVLVDQADEWVPSWARHDHLDDYPSVPESFDPDTID